MKKAILGIMICCFPFAYAAAQGGGTAPLAKGEKQFNFGTGISDDGFPVYGTVDFAVHDDVTLGPAVNIRFSDDMKVGVFFKADYHFNYLIGIPETWDFYAGLRSGFDFGDDVDFNIGAEVGGRWYWSEKWGMNLEFSGGTGFNSTFGLTMKF